MVLKYMYVCNVAKHMYERDAIFMIALEDGS